MTAETPESQAKVSVPDDSLDALVEAASVPNLGTLFQRAKDRGLIKAMSNYGERAGASS